MIRNIDFKTGAETTEPSVSTPVPMETQVRAIQSSIQRMMDAEAQSIGYDSLLSVCTYATSPNAKFQAEGQYFVTRRDDIWTYCYTELAKVEAGTRAMPTVDELLLELPALNLPV